jgi:hypothetical protein
MTTTAPTASGPDVRVVPTADAGRATTPAPGQGSGRLQSRRRATTAVALAAGAWLLPFAAHASHADWLVLLTGWLGTASLLRAGRLLVDRLVLAGILVAAFLLSAGLLFSLSPWGLHPVIVGGVMLSAVVAAKVVSGRKPRLPARLVPTDATIVGAGMLSWHYLHAPTAGRSFVQKIPYIAAREDMFNHYTLYDTIHRIGGYPFLKPGATKPYMSAGIFNPTGLRFYPSGTHYLYALFDIFLRSDVDPGSSIGEYDRFVLYSVATLAVLAAAIVWAARWIAGPGLGGWRRGFVCTVVGGLAAVGQLSTLYWQGFNAHAAGLAALAVAVAVCCRPPRCVREQILLLAAVIVVAAFVYTLTAVLVLGTAGIAVAVHRRRLLRHWRFAVGVAAPAGCVALVPYVAQRFAGYSVSHKFLMDGDCVHFSRNLSMVFGLAALTALATRNGRRSPVWRASSAAVLWCWASALALCCYVYVSLGYTTYYCEKLIEGAWVVSLVGFGAVGMMLKPGPSISSLTHHRRRAGNLAASGLAVGAGAVLTGVVPLAAVQFPGWRPAQDVTWGSVWRAGDISSGFGSPLADAAKHHLIGDDTPTIILFSDVGPANWRTSLFVAAIHHDRGLITDRALDELTGSDDLATLKFPGPGGHLSATDEKSLENLKGLIRDSHVPLRMVMWNRGLADYLRAFGAAEPRLGLKVVVLPNP